MTEAEKAKKLIMILKGSMGLSERLVKRLKCADKILCNSLPVHVNLIVSEGDKIEALIEFDDVNDDIIPQDIPIEIVYEDEGLIAVNKQPGIVVHPTSNHPSGTVANAIMLHYLSNDIRTRIRPVSRLDRDTSGIIVFAKNQFVQENLIRQMSSKTFTKEYLGIVTGIIETPSGTINLPIDRKPDSIMLRHVSPEGASSVTHYHVIEYLNNATLLSFILETGRTHQIRVHCQAIGHPLIGDTLYPSLELEIADSEPEFPISRQALHSSKTVFLHPVTGITVELHAALPADIQKALEILKK